jgi:hypothetical protein
VDLGYHLIGERVGKSLFNGNCTIDAFIGGKGVGDDTGGKVVRGEMITVCNPQMERGEDLLQFTTSWSAGG